MNPFGDDFAVKPDGTPYKFTHALLHQTCEWTYPEAGVMKDLVERAGGEMIDYDPQFNIENQTSFIDDCISTIKPDAIFIDVVNEAAMAPAVDKAENAGIPVFAYDLEPFTDSYTAYVRHDFDTEIGSWVVGNWFVQKAEELDKHIYILEVWGMRSMQTSVDRHDGFHMATGQSPLVTVIETSDSGWSDDTAANLVMDAFNAHPELNGLFNQDGGGTGCMQGIETIGRLLPPEDPDHVWTCLHGCDTRVVEEMEKGNLDAFGTHGPWDLIDVTVQLAFINLILGQPIPKDIIIPMTVVEPSTLYTEKIFGGPAAYPLMPMGQWDKWPVLDLSSINIETPTKEMRQRLMGY